MNKLIAKNFIKENLTDYYEGGKAQYTGEDVEELMIKFTKLHLNLAVKKIIKKAKIIHKHPKPNTKEMGIDTIDKLSVINAYPLTNIK